MTGRLSVVGLAAAMLLLICLAPAGATAAGSVRLSVGLDAGARLGAATALHTRLSVDTRRQSSPVTTISLRYPASLGVTTSGLGLASCTRPASDFSAVVVDGIGLAGCPRNAVMATGRAIGEIRLDGTGYIGVPGVADIGVIRELGTVTVLSGPLRRGRLGIVAFVDGWNPIGAKLAYGGEVAPAPAPFGGALTIRVNQLPAGWGAEIALTDITMTIGARDIVYHERAGGRTVRYRPGGVELPARCPAKGLPFMAEIEFANGVRESATALTPCPVR